MSQLFRTAQMNFGDSQDTLDFLLKIHQQYLDSSHFQASNLATAVESLEYLAAQTSHLTRWLTNYIDRTNVQINLFFNLANQRDNRINLDIARLTSNIAVATQQDSSSMITMAAVTMFFLPGTFVSALFGMVFFDSGSDPTGGTSLFVRPQWWLYPTITIPLTMLVFATWIFWQRRRNSSPPPDEKSRFSRWRSSKRGDMDQHA
ncbi:hypothetical protein B0H34DRAFT_736964 [Crassisporium funariophilum]|nr:hypothetical protein B0H34DRAFT_736964 [Crassisporium funariophilum]